jgi:hypothetical protein
MLSSGMPYNDAKAIQKYSFGAYKYTIMQMAEKYILSNC